MNLRSAEIVNTISILTGSFAMAFGVVSFLSPNQIATGGTAGLAIVLHNVIHLPVGVWMALINIPLVMMGFRYLGKRFAVKTILCIAAIVLFVDVLMQIVKLDALSKDPLLATLYGGVSVGVGLGLIFKGGASAGGGTILAKIIASKSSIKTSTVVLILDALVVVSASIVFKSVELGLWSMISIYVGTRMIDAVLLGAGGQKIVHISSSKNLKELSALIARELGVTGTIVQGNDLGASEYKDIIFLMIDKNRLTPLKQLVAAYDANVKMIVMEATEVLGKESERM